MFTWLRPAYGLVLLTLAHGFDAHVCLRYASHLSERVGNLGFLLSSSPDVLSSAYGRPRGREPYEIKTREKDFSLKIILFENYKIRNHKNEVSNRIYLY